MLFADQSPTSLLVRDDRVSHQAKLENALRFTTSSLAPPEAMDSATAVSEQLYAYGWQSSELPYYPVNRETADSRTAMGASTTRTAGAHEEALQGARSLFARAVALSRRLAGELDVLTTAGEASQSILSSSPACTLQQMSLFFADIGLYPDSQANTGVPSDKSSAFVTSLATITDPAAVEEAIVSVYGEIDDLLLENRVSECNAILARVDTNRTHSDILLAFLMSTAMVPRDQIPNRVSFYEATRKRFTGEVGDNETSEILDRLR